MAGNILFGVDIAGLINSAISPGLLDALITRPALGERDPADLTGGRPASPQTQGARGFWEDFDSDPQRPADLEVDDRKAVLIGDTIPDGWVPRRNWSITIDGQTLFVVRPLSVDPARAVYVFLCRDRAGPDKA